MRNIKNIRLKNFDYSNNGYYFVTICTNNQKPYLDLENVKKIIKNEIKSLEHISGVKIDYWIIMPDHIHIIIILEKSIYHLGEIIRRFKAKTSKTTGIKIWQPNYYEHVIRNEQALYKIREYIQNNPEKKLFDFKTFYE